MRILPTILCLFGFLVRIAAAGNSIEFSAALQQFSGEGILYHRLVFKDDKRRVYYQPPRDWRCTVDGNRLRLVPPQKTFAEAEIASVPLDEPTGFDDPTVTALTEQIVAALPPGSQQAAVLKQEQNGLPFNNFPTFEVLVSYKVLGDTFERAVFIVNTPATQIIFKLSARKTDFEALYRAFRASIPTWEWQPEPTP